MRHRPGRTRRADPARAALGHHRPTHGRGDRPGRLRPGDGVTAPTAPAAPAAGDGNPRIVIIGAGPTGLGAGYRLQELGYDDWVILEANDYVGGLATSFTDEAGFTYDIGGHVMFSHYQYYDDLVDKLMGGEFTTLQREAWVWMEDRFIPYPFQ